MNVTVKVTGYAQKRQKDWTGLDFKTLDGGVSSFNEITRLKGDNGIVLVSVVGIGDMEVVVAPNQRVNFRLKFP